MFAVICSKNIIALLLWSKRKKIKERRGTENGKKCMLSIHKVKGRKPSRSSRSSSNFKYKKKEPKGKSLIVLLYYFCSLNTLFHLLFKRFCCSYLLLLCGLFFLCISFIFIFHGGYGVCLHKAMVLICTNLMIIQ